MQRYGMDVVIWWPDVASIHARWMASRGIRNVAFRPGSSVGFPPWLAQVEAKSGNQITAPFPSRCFPLWLVQVEANLVAGHVTEPNEATTEASSVACSDMEWTS